MSNLLHAQRLQANLVLRACASAGVLFGLLSIAAAGAGLFGGAEHQARLGATVGFVLWFNFLAGFAYVAVALGLWWRRSWSIVWSWVIVDATALVFMLFAVHVLMGGAYEWRTVAAMSFRLLFWLLVAWLARHYRETFTMA
jgi:hypothetical protein